MTTETPAAKKIQAFYSSKPLEGKPVPTVVSLWIVDSGASGAPEFDGTIGEQKVSLRIRNAAKGPFMSVQKTLKPEEIKADGYKEEQIGTANLVVTKSGFPSLAITLKASPDETIWANVSKSAPEELLVKAGLNLEIQATKRAAASPG